MYHGPSGTARATAGLMTVLFLITILNAAYVGALPSATIFYVANVLLHVVLGAATATVLVWRYRRSPRSIPLLAAALLGLYLMAAGATHDHRAIFYLHIVLAVAGLAIL